MAKAKLPVKAEVEPGEKEIHYGYEFTADKEGNLFAEVPDELMKIELKAGRLLKA